MGRLFGKAIARSICNQRQQMYIFPRKKSMMSKFKCSAAFRHGPNRWRCAAAVVVVVDVAAVAAVVDVDAVVVVVVDVAVIYC